MADLQEFCINGDCSELMDADDYYKKGLVYTKTEANNTFADKDDTYTKAEVDALVQGGGSGLIYVQDVSPTGGVKANNMAGNTASGQYAFAQGNATDASGAYAHAEGDNTEATGIAAHAEGISTHATGQSAHAEGSNAYATATNAHAEGYQAHAEGQNAHAEGNAAYATGDNAHAEGLNTRADSDNQHVSGKFNAWDDQNVYAEIVGNGTSNSNRRNARTLDWDGNAWFLGRVDATNVGIHVVSSGSANLNTYRTEGIWFFTSAVTLTNCPAGVNGWLEVLATTTSTVKQFWHRFGSSTTFRDEYFRIYDGSWSSWERFATATDLNTPEITNAENNTVMWKRSMKYPDGTLICCIRSVVTVAVNTAWGAIYYGNVDLTGITWPVAFAATPYCSVSVQNGSDAMVNLKSVTTTTVGNVYLYRPVNTASASYHISVIAIGRWK